MAVKNVETIDIEAESAINVIEIEIDTGSRGPRGDQKVFAQENNPAVEHGWGINDKGKIWIEVPGVNP